MHTTHLSASTFLSCLSARTALRNESNRHSAPSHFSALVQHTICASENVGEKMGSIVLQFPPQQGNRREVMKATPMQTLQAVLAEACSRCKPPLDPAGFILMNGKKEMVGNLASVPQDRAYAALNVNRSQCMNVCRGVTRVTTNQRPRRPRGSFQLLVTVVVVRSQPAIVCSDDAGSRADSPLRQPARRSEARCRAAPSRPRPTRGRRAAPASSCAGGSLSTHRRAGGWRRVCGYR